MSGRPFQKGKYAGGLVATTLGGMALLVGITFSAVGPALESGGMTSAGLITGAAGAVTLTGGISLMMRAVPAVSVGSASGYLSGRTVGLAGRF